MDVSILLSIGLMELFRNLHFEISFADALIHMPKFASMFKKMLNNKDKLIELTKTPLNENCSAVVLKKLPEKLGDPGRFLIPCDFSEFDSYLALADLADPRVPLILGRPFLRTAHALIDVYEGEITLRNDDQSLTLKCESWISGSVATTTPSPVTTIPLFPLPRRHSLLLVESDFILFEEADAFMPSMTVQISTELMLMYYDPGVTISFSRHSQQYPLPQPNQGDYSPGIQKDLKVVEPQKSSIEYATSYEPKVKLPEVELKELPRISKDNYETFCPTSKERLTLKSMTSSRKKWKKLLDAGLIYPDLGSLGFVRLASLAFPNIEKEVGPKLQFSLLQIGTNLLKSCAMQAENSKIPTTEECVAMQLFTLL
ncbi:hypothetical protein Tco_0858027 [Tanacetum coccineum]|uniref:Reverse transcriptase domain-containing protein n=1 Tax=Tanacetum coccineum TaxID=301880 RepID=A0ABQ5B817_9ASTR